MSKSSSILAYLESRQAKTDRGNKISPPPWITKSVQYEVVTGSVAYGVSNALSDMDINGFCIPPKESIFPHLAGEIPGFGKPKNRFEQYQEHHIQDPDGKIAENAYGEPEPVTYDMTMYSIVKYFQLTMENNPNMVDSLFVPDGCIKFMTPVGALVRENRRLFLHKGSWHKFKGYAYSQLHKAKLKSPEAGSKRAALIEQYGWDVKYGYHLVRLLDEVEQILTTGDINLQRAKEQMKEVRRGEWSLERMEKYFEENERRLEQVYTDSTLPHSPQEEKIKSLLMQCLEQHYGSISQAVVVEGNERELLRRIKEMCEQAGI